MPILSSSLRTELNMDKPQHWQLQDTGCGFQDIWCLCSLCGKAGSSLFTKMSLSPGNNHLFQKCLVMNQRIPDKTAHSLLPQQNRVNNLLSRMNNTAQRTHRHTLNFHCNWHTLGRVVQNLQLFLIPFICIQCPGSILNLNNTQLQTSLYIRHLSNVDGGREKARNKQGLIQLSSGEMWRVSIMGRQINLKITTGFDSVIYT